MIIIIYTNKINLFSTLLGQFKMKSMNNGGGDAGGNGNAMGMELEGVSAKQSLGLNSHLDANEVQMPFQRRLDGTHLLLEGF